jgi:hypothetical protein
LPSACDLALGKDFFNLKIYFAECPVSDTQQRPPNKHSAKLLFRVPTDKHLTKNVFRVLKKSLSSVPRLALGKNFFTEC